MTTTTVQPENDPDVCGGGCTRGSAPEEDILSQDTYEIINDERDYLNEKEQQIFDIDRFFADQFENEDYNNFYGDLDEDEIFSSTFKPQNIYNSHSTKKSITHHHSD